MFITSGTLRRIEARDSPCTLSAYATLSAAVRLGRSLKSWKTQPIWRRSVEIFRCCRRAMSRPPMMIFPLVASSSLRRSRTSVVLPEPDAPTMKTNSPLSIPKLTLSSATTSGS